MIFNSNSIKLYKNWNFIFLHCHIILERFPCNIISCISWCPITDLFILVLQITSWNYVCNICYNRCCLSKSHCTCHQAKTTISSQTPVVAPISPKTCTGRFSSMLNPNLPSDLLSDHSRNTSLKHPMNVSSVLLYNNKTWTQTKALSKFLISYSEITWRNSNL